MTCWDSYTQLQHLLFINERGNIMKKLTNKEMGIAAFQLLALLSLPELYKHEQKALSRIRSVFQKLLLRAMNTSLGEGVLENALAKLSKGVAELYAGSKGPELNRIRLAMSYDKREKFWQALADDIQALASSELTSKEDETARRKAQPQDVRVKFQQDQDRILRLINSVAMNSTWEITLGLVGTAIKSNDWLTPARLDVLQAELYMHFSSPQGRTKVAEKVAILWPKAGKSSWVLEDVVQVTVSLDRLQLQGNPVIQKMIAHPGAHLPVATTVNAVFANLSGSVAKGQDPMEVAYALLTDVETLARKRIREMDNAKKARAKAAQAEAEVQLLGQLKGMPANLLNALKKNPDLLKQV